MRSKQIFLGGVAILACAGLLYSLGAFKGLLAVAGAIFSAAILTWPMLGVVCVVLAGTCFQIIGSSQLIGLPVSLGKLFGLLTLAGWGIHFWRRRPVLAHSSQLVPMGVFLLVISASALFEPLMVQRAGQPMFGMSGVFRILQVYLLFFLLANLGGESRATLIASLVTVTAATAITGIISLLEYYYPAEWLRWGQEETFSLGALVEQSGGVEMRRVTGGVGDPNWLAYTAATVLPINLFLWRYFRNSIARLLILGAAGLQSVALVLSFTRSGFIGLAFAMAYLLYRKRLPIVPLTAAAILAIATSPLWLPAGFVDRMFSKKYLREGSTPARTELIKDGIAAFLEEPFFGHGYGQFGIFFMKQIQSRARTDWSNEVSDSISTGRELPENIGVHNLYLEVGVEYGLAGLIPFVLIMVFARLDLRVVELKGGPDDRELAICLTSCILCFAVCGAFGHLKILKVLWIMLGLSAAARSVVLSEARAISPVPQGSA